MKKLLTLLLAVLMLVSLAACGGKTEPTEPATPEVTEATYTLGMGTVVKLDSSKESNAQVDATVAAVVLDADGKIVNCTIDAIQNKMDVSEGVANPEATFLTKMEKGDDYNMVKFAADCNIEWYDQAKNFANYCVGKTAAEVGAIETTERNDGVGHDGYIVAADADLFAQCSITITDFKEAVVKACNDEQGTTFTAEPGTFALGLAVSSNATSSTDPTADADGVVAMYSDYACTVVNNDGVILASLTDAIQPKVAFDADGLVGETTFKATKRELKEDYNMVKFAADCNIEWYQQAANFTNYVVGKTADEVLAIPTVERADGVGHDGYIVAADADLFAQCSITITTMKEVVARAAKLALNPLH